MHRSAGCVLQPARLAGKLLVEINTYKMIFFFRSRISVVLSLFVFGVMGISLYSMIKLYISKPSINSLIGMLIFCFLFYLLAMIWFGTRYIISEGKLLMKTWFLRSGEINISSIESINRSYCPLASNAVSLKRLEVRLKKGSKYPFLLISPNNEKLFLRIIASVNPSVKINVTDKKGLLRIWDWDI
jgi:hypothetical protein